MEPGPDVAIGRLPASMVSQGWRIRYSEFGAHLRRQPIEEQVMDLLEMDRLAQTGHNE